ncbi:Tim44 domain-containing protein [Legionella nagasakiensis]|uniref:Tim44 domain-containing protein n=1 Tax=Legionella nagasakiensis TaxID=535290 RepID=UPI001056679D|nr:Tim44-like domain-containing protein [Legionella nagasakiensis]
MYKLFTYLLIALLAFGLVVNEASAKRFGGGRSFGVQRSKSSLFSSNHAKNSKSLGQRSQASKWGGVLGGLLVGGLLASLFMGHGLANGLISWLIVGSLIFFIVSFMRKRMQPGFQAAHSAGFSQNRFSDAVNFSSARADYQAADYPHGFEQESFLRDAKVKFIRLQAAYDQKNMQDLSAFTAPEIFAEIKMQIEERGDEPNTTEVVQLETELLDVAKQADGWVATVRFTGFIKENSDPMTQLDELWHFRQFAHSNDWVVGGIQQ